MLDTAAPEGADGGNEGRTARRDIVKEKDLAVGYLLTGEGRGVGVLHVGKACITSAELLLFSPLGAQKERIRGE